MGIVKREETFSIRVPFIACNCDFDTYDGNS